MRHLEDRGILSSTLNVSFLKYSPRITLFLKIPREELSALLDEYYACWPMTHLPVVVESLLYFLFDMCQMANSNATLPLK